MSENTSFGFGNFIPGFDFLQNLAKGAAAGVPGASGWVAPTLDVAELDKRIQELKAVQFWLEQNARALTATVQALEVQKMTLATLQGMNVAMGDMADAFTGKRAAAAAPQSAQARPGAKADHAADKPRKAGAASKPAAPELAAGLADPMQWWNALTQQFQQIAAGALQDVGAQQAAFDATRAMADGVLKSAGDMASQMVAQGMAAAQPGTAASKRAARPKAAASKPAAAKSAAGKAPRARRS